MLLRPVFMVVKRIVYCREALRRFALLYDPTLIPRSVKPVTPCPLLDRGL